LITLKKQWTLRAVTIYLSEQQELSDWMRKEMTNMLGKRYKLTHLSEDMNVNYAKLYRFMRGKNVGTELYDSFFRVYLRQWNS
jgi:hypothetical protein